MQRLCILARAAACITLVCHAYSTCRQLHTLQLMPHLDDFVCLDLVCLCLLHSLGMLSCTIVRGSCERRQQHDADTVAWCIVMHGAICMTQMQSCSLIIALLLDAQLHNVQARCLALVQAFKYGTYWLASLLHCMIG